MRKDDRKIGIGFVYGLLVVLTVVFIFPILLVFMNSFKSRLYVSTVPFALPAGNMFVGLENYINGLTTSGFSASKTPSRRLWTPKNSTGLWKHTSE